MMYSLVVPLAQLSLRREKYNHFVGATYQLTPTGTSPCTSRQHAAYHISFWHLKVYLLGFLPVPVLLCPLTMR